MAKCRNCGTAVPDGAEYCAECLSKLNTAKDSESYLDSLLNAVMTEEPKRREIVYPKKEASSLVSVSEKAESYSEPVVETEEENYKEQVAETVAEFYNEPQAEVFFEPAGKIAETAGSMEFAAEDPMIKEPDSLEDKFDFFFEEEAEIPQLKNYSIFDEVDESTVDSMLAEDLGESEDWDIPGDTYRDEEEFTKEEVPEEDMSEDNIPLEDTPDFEPEDVPETVALDEMVEVPLSEVGDIEDLFGLLQDERGADALDEIEIGMPEVISSEDLDAAPDTFSGIVEEPEESVTEFGDFADLFGGTEDIVQDKASEPEAQPMEDFADLFAGLDDGEGLFEFGTQPIELDEEEDNSGDVLSAMAAVAATVESSLKEKSLDGDGKKEKKKGFFSSLYHKLFDNVKVDPSKIKQPPTKEELEAKKREKEEAKARNKEEKEALLAEKKEQEKQVKLEKQRVKKEAKAEKKAKKMEEAKLLLEEMERTRINRAGASIVFIFFAMIAVVIIVGTSIFSYSLSIKNAEYEFENDRYTAAYNEIYGLDIKDEDIMLYDRIMTVMYVQKQLNSYDNYNRMNDKPKALDSLLKGLQRYEKYIELAVELDVDGDLESVRNKILEKINESFSLTEQEAMEIIQSDSQAEYSKKVYDAVDNLE